jgi:hypothetical protein
MSSRDRGLLVRTVQYQYDIISISKKQGPFRQSELGLGSWNAA